MSGSKPRPRTDAENLERFWNLVFKTPTCWTYPTTVPGGYGGFWVNGGTVRPARWIYRMTHGPIPEDQWVLHRCDNPPCVRPDHLFLGSPSDNVRDCIEKGRRRKEWYGVRGERHPHAKLSESDVLAIRSEYALGKTRQVDLAEHYGVTQVAISALLRGHTWKHLPLTGQTPPPSTGPFLR